MSGLLQPSSAQNWLSSQCSSSGLIVKRTLRVDIPVEKYPNVCINFLLLCACSWFSFQQYLMFICCYSLILLGVSLVLGGTLLSEWKQVLTLQEILLFSTVRTVETSTKNWRKKYFWRFKWLLRPGETNYVENTFWWALGPWKKVLYLF